MRRVLALALAALAAGSLTACNEGSLGTAINTATTPGTLIENPPPRVASLNVADFTAQLNANTSGQQLLAIAGAPTCGIDFHYFQYQTVGANAEQATASGAIMAPTGGAGCTGARPILLYTHGTAVTKAYNLANIADSNNEAWTESAMMAAFFAAHGYIVVASNYAGYDSSSLAYHPYLNADQQSKDVINALTAARAALKGGLPSAVTDNGRLFITGYSQGGHVAMATHRAMQALNMTVTAAAPMSGPYAMLSFGDAAVAYSSPSLGSTIYYPMIINSYQKAYGGIYTSLASFYNSSYATGIDTLIPGQYTFTTLITAGKLPQLGIFNSQTPGYGDTTSGNATVDFILQRPTQVSNPIGYLGFDNPSYLINNSERIAYALDALANPDGVVPAATTGLPAANPTHPLRQALKTNDLRGFSPQAPTMLCGGMNDPEVFYKINTLTMKALWTAVPPPAPVTYVDVDPSTNGNPALSGQIATIIGTIAATVYGSEPTAAAAKVAADVQGAIVTNGAFGSFFAAPGIPNGPQGVMVMGIAGVAGQAVTAYIAKGDTPATIGPDIGNAIIAYYHFPLTQSACEVAAQAFFAAIP
jgi:hypothetical protein